MITIKKSNVVGNTFIAYAMEAFNLNHHRQVKIYPDMNYGSWGTITINGTWWDWEDNGETINFMET